MLTVNLLQCAHPGRANRRRGWAFRLEKTMYGRSVPKKGSRLRGAFEAGALVAALGSALLVVEPRPTSAATYYVDNTNPACGASGPGTQTAPYCAISAAAAQHPGAGNTILVVAGTYREQVSIPASGASG